MKNIFYFSLILLLFIVAPHPGKLDKKSGHNDTKNASKIGSYHFHCNGSPAHLHKNGVCPYANKKVEKKVEKKKK